MDSFETQNAAEWQPVERKKKKPQSSRYEASSSNTPRYQSQYRTHTSPIPYTIATSQREDTLIDIEEPDEQPLLKTQVNSSNPFASLASEESSSLANSTPINGRIGVLPPLEPTIPVEALHQARQSAMRRASTPTKQPETSANGLEDLDGLDPSFVFTPSLEPPLPSSERVMADNQQGSSLISPLDEDVPSMKREEDEAWFEAQLGKSTLPSATQSNGTDISRHDFQQPGQLVYPLGMPVVASYRGHDSRSPGSTRSRGTPRGRGGRYSRGGRQESPSNLSQRSTRNFSGSEDTSRAVFHHTLQQNSTRGRGHGTRGSRSQGIHTQPKPRPISENMPLVYSTTRRCSQASSEQSERKSLAAKVASAIESDKQVQSLALYHDTAATTEWRKKGMRPGKTIPLPRLNLAGENFNKNPSSKPAIARPAEISMITNTHIDQVWRKFKDGKMVQLLVYGTNEAVDEASKLIREWINEIHDLQRSMSKWAKVWSFNEKAERRLRKRLVKDEERKKYRQAISEGEILVYNTEFVWPLPKEPEQILGMNYEALDPIRMNGECYITCEKMSQTIFRIQGNNEEKMRKALERMRRLPAEWHAKMFEAEPFVILDIPYAFDPDDLPPVIKVPYRLPRPLLAPTAAKDDGVTFRFKGPHQLPQVPYIAPEDSPAGKLLEAVAETTRHARYFRNMLKLHMHLGTFAARRTQRPDIDKDTYSFLSFSEMMEEHDKMDARASMEIGDLIVERHVLARCFEASHILAPQDAWTYKLSDVQPVYCATFEIANPAGQAGDLFLDVELSADDGVTNVVSKRWSQLAKGKTEPRKLLDGSIIDLQNGGLTWHLGLDEFIPVDEHGLSPDYQVFPGTLSLDSTAAHDLLGGHNFVIYRSRGDRLIKVPIRSVRQRRCWRFNTLASRGEWVVEVSHVGKTTIGTDGQQTLFEPRWTFGISNNNWNKLLSSNSRADIGQVASWGHGNPGNLLFPLNPDSSALTGVARQDDELYSEESEHEDDNADTSSPKERDDDPEDQPSLQNFEQLLNLLRTLTDVVVGNSHLQ